MSHKYRKSDSGSQGKRPGWQRLLIGVGLGVLAFKAGAYAIAYLSTHPPRRRIFKTPAGSGIPYEEVVFDSRDGLKLNGWFVPVENARGGIILSHGFPQNRQEMLFWARMLYPAGFNLFMFDFRALGESEGDLCTVGLHEQRDLLGALDYFCGRPEMRGLPVGAFGLSMGGAVSLMVASQDERIRCVATHGAYASLDRAISQHGKLYAGPLGASLARAATKVGRKWFPTDPRTVSPLEAIKTIAPRPVLLFHGSKDLIVNPDDGLLLYNAASEPKTYHPLPKSWHVRVSPQEMPAYEAQFVSFFCESLGE